MDATFHMERDGHTLYIKADKRVCGPQVFKGNDGCWCLWISNKQCTKYVAEGSEDAIRPPEDGWRPLTCTDHYIEGTLCVDTARLPNPCLSFKEFTVGMRIEVSKRFTSNDDSGSTLKRGLKGTITKVDDEGDLCIDFDKKRHHQFWVTKENYEKLRVLRKHERESEKTQLLNRIQREKSEMAARTEKLRSEMRVLEDKYNRENQMWLKRSQELTERLAMAEKQRDDARKHMDEKIDCMRDRERRCSKVEKRDAGRAIAYATFASGCHKRRALI